MSKRTQTPTKSTKSSKRKAKPSNEESSLKKVRTGELPLDDIRMKIADIFGDAYNNWDRESFAKVMKLYVEEDCRLLYQFRGHRNPLGPSRTEIYGRDAILTFWDCLFASIPDSLFTAYPSKIKVLPNEYSSIVCPFTFVGTKLFNLNGIDDWSHLEKVEVRPEIGTTSTSFRVIPDKPDVVATAEVSFGLNTEQMVSQRITLLGTVTYHMNPQKKIYKLSVIHAIKDS